MKYLLIFLVIGAYGVLLPLYNYQGVVTFDQRMFNNCMSTLSVNISRPVIHQPWSGSITIKCHSKWTPSYIDFEPRAPVVSFSTGCFAIRGTINYGMIHFYTSHNCWKCNLTLAQVSSCLENLIGQKYNFSFIGVIGD